MVLRDFRETVKKANEVLDNVHQVTDIVANPVTTIAGIIAGVTKGVRAVRAISSLVESKEDDEEARNEKALNEKAPPISFFSKLSKNRSDLWSERFFCVNMLPTPPVISNRIILY